METKEIVEFTAGILIAFVILVGVPLAIKNLRKNILPNKITVTITTEQFANSDYNSIRNCSLAKALKAAGYNKPIVGPWDVQINGKMYEIPELHAQIIYNRTGKANRPPLTLILTKEKY